MEKPQTLPAGCATLTLGVFKFSRSIAHTSGVLYGGFRSRACSCAPATAVSIMPTARALPALPNAAYSNTATRSKVTRFSLKRARCPHLPKPRTSNRGVLDALDRKYCRLVRSARPTRQVNQRDAGPSRAEADRKLVL